MASSRFIQTVSLPHVLLILLAGLAASVGLHCASAQSPSDSNARGAHGSDTNKLQSDGSAGRVEELKLGAR
ncbi:MAG TPA: hypothetical protein VFS67_16710 [Polyangiaceae bacterium]|jgi:hypothetical protein|nr:hypothetical protein [Polyangiaceae bacterium]